MRPKDYYDQATIQEDARYIFTLMPPDFEKQYEKYVKEPIENINLDDGQLTCESYMDIETGTDKVDGVWRNIQKAGIIIANITGFIPNVMLELGVALMKKGRVLLIAEKTLDGKTNLPFNISNLGVEFYEARKPEELENIVTSHVRRWIPSSEEKPIKNIEAEQFLREARANSREGKYDVALVLFEKIDKLEPGNCHIFKEWGITYKEKGDLENAFKKMKSAMGYAKYTKHKCEIYMELGDIYRLNKSIDAALVAFEKAENLDRDNPVLYDRWAFLFYQLGKFNDAMNKMMQAVKLEPDNMNYKWKFEFYSKKFLDSKFKMDLEAFLNMKEVEKEGPYTPKPYFPHPNDPSLFERFTNRHKPKEEVYGEIAHVDPGRGIYVRLDLNIVGLIWSKKLPNNFDANEKFRVGNKIKVILLWFNNDKNQIDLGLVD